MTGLLRHPLFLLLLFVLIGFGVQRSFSGAPVISRDAPDGIFSAERAMDLLEALIAENQPHVMGSEANRQVRDRISDYLESWGYEVEVQRLFHCHPAFGGCGNVENLVARLPGLSSGQALLLTSHYDSSWSSPGAGDAGSGVAAILEIARMSAERGAFDNDLIFLFTDGEEQGLIGAHAFAAKHPAFQQVKLVLNLEARGVSGPSAMFETGEGNRSLIRVLSRNLDRPVANSLTYEVYKRMPNDTDYSVYRNQGVMGLNFAFTQGVALYHSRLDDLAHLDVRSLQHHGDNAWAMLQALGGRDLGHMQSRENAGYIDLFGWKMIHYPESIASGLDLVLSVWVLLAITLAFRQKFGITSVLMSCLALLVLLLLVFSSAWVLSYPLGRWPEIFPLEHPQPWPGRIVLLLSVVASLLVTVKLFKERVPACSWMLMAWVIIGALSVWLASRLPTAAYLGLIPLAAFALGSLIDVFRRHSAFPLLFASIAAFVASAYISLYHYQMLDALGHFDQSALKALMLIPLLLTVMPMLLSWFREREMSWQPTRILIIAIVALTLLHTFLPGFTPDRPRTLALVHQQVFEEKSGRLLLESGRASMPVEYAEDMGFEPDLESGDPPRRWFKPAERSEMPVPTVSAQKVEPLAAYDWTIRLDLVVADKTRFVTAELPVAVSMGHATINGVIAWSPSEPGKSTYQPRRLRVVSPEPGEHTFMISGSGDSPGQFKITSWYALPEKYSAMLQDNWPSDAQPNRDPHRAEVIQSVEVR